MAQTPRSQGRAAPLPLGCLALPPPRRFPGTPLSAGWAPRGWGGLGAAGVSSQNLPGSGCPCTPPALSCSSPPENVLGFGVVMGLKNLQAEHVSGLKYFFFFNKELFFFFFCLSSILMLRVTSISNQLWLYFLFETAS